MSERNGNAKRNILYVEVPLDVKRWIERQAAERMLAGRPHSERTMGAVIRDVLAEARDASESERKVGVAA